MYFVMRCLAHVKQFQDAGWMQVLVVCQALLCWLQHLLGVNRWSHLQTHRGTGYYVTALIACFLSHNSAAMRQRIKQNCYHWRKQIMSTRAVDCHLQAVSYDRYAQTSASRTFPWANYMCSKNVNILPLSEDCLHHLVANTVSSPSPHNPLAPLYQCTRSKETSNCT